MFGLESLLAGPAKELASEFTSGIRGIITTFKLPPEEAIKFEQAMTENAQKFVMGMLDVAQKSQDSARQMQMATHSTMPEQLTKAYTLMFFGLMIFNGIIGIMGIEIGGYAQRSFDQFTGVLFAFVTSSKEFYLGTSMTETAAWMQDKWSNISGKKVQP